MRAESAARQARPLAKARDAFARRLDAVMHEHWLRGEEAYSNVAVARACGVNEKSVREWRRGEKRIPPECIAKLPHQIFVEVVAILEELHGQRPKRALKKIQQGIADLPSELAHEDPTEIVKALVDVQGQAAELMRRAMGGSR